MQINGRSAAIGVIPKPETRSTEWRQANREVFGENSVLTGRHSLQTNTRPHLLA